MKHHRLGMAAVFATVVPAFADTLTCSTWNGIRTCQDGRGYVSHETTWQGLTSGQDNQGNQWTTSRWRDSETTTVRRKQ
jgi:hypothetical protein